MFTIFIFRLSLNHPVNSSPFTFNNRRSTPNIMSPFNSPMTGIRFNNIKVLMNTCINSLYILK